MNELAVPAPLAVDRSLNAALYEWIDGERVMAPGNDDLDQLIAFTERLIGYGRDPAAADLPPASEACLSAGELAAQLVRREARFSAVVADETALADFLVRLRAYRERIVAGLGPDNARPLAPQFRMLNPSDFGFHNSLKCPDGRIVFLDFEYFGWDDPVKLVADLILHPAIQLTSGQRRYLAQGMSGPFAADPDFRPRLERLLPLYAVRWCLIMLNEFLPERWARRAVAGQSGHADIKARQLAKAEALLSAAPNIVEDIA